MMNETLTAIVTISHIGQEVARLTGTGLRGLMQRVDSEHPSGAVCVRGETTSDGSVWGPGRGRVLATREGKRWIVG